MKKTFILFLEITLTTGHKQFYTTWTDATDKEEAMDEVELQIGQEEMFTGKEEITKITLLSCIAIRGTGHDIMTIA